MGLFTYLFIYNLVFDLYSNPYSFNDSRVFGLLFDLFNAEGQPELNISRSLHVSVFINFLQRALLHITHSHNNLVIHTVRGLTLTFSFITRPRAMQRKNGKGAYSC